jgi:hypothetical protein
MTQGDPHEEAGRDEEVAEGEVHDGPLRILVSKCLQESIETERNTVVVQGFTGTKIRRPMPNDVVELLGGNNSKRRWVSSNSYTVSGFSLPPILFVSCFP